jgi:hypothetical protein
MTFTLPPRTQELLKAFAARPTLTVDEIRAAAEFPTQAPKPRKISRAELITRLTEISERCAALPLLDARSPGQIIGFNDHGAFD